MDKFEIREQVPAVADYIRIRLEAGLSRKSEQAAAIGLKNSLFSRLMQYTRKSCPPTAYVSLIADHNTTEFYRRYGFTPTEPPMSAGMYLRIHPELP